MGPGTTQFIPEQIVQMTNPAKFLHVSLSIKRLIKMPLPLDKYGPVLPYA